MKRFKPKKSKPLPRRPAVKEIIRFLGKIRYGRVPKGHKTPCWLFNGCHDEDGYGQFHFANTSQWANRFSYQAFKGDLPPGEEAGHTCHNASCVNPDHLTPQSKGENSADANYRTGYRGNGGKNGVPHNQQESDMPDDFLT